jgi:hypothetical protein
MVSFLLKSSSCPDAVIAIPPSHNGKISEIIITPSAISSADRERVEGYLAHKWDLTADLPSGHPYKTTPP